MSGFWTRAKMLMNKKGITKSDLAKATEKPFTTVFHWIQRDTLPDVCDALKVATVLGTSIQWLCTGEESGAVSKEMKSVAAILRDVSKEDWEDVAAIIKIYNKGRGDGRLS